MCNVISSLGRLNWYSTYVSYLTFSYFSCARLRTITCKLPVTWASIDVESKIRTIGKNIFSALVFMFG